MLYRPNGASASLPPVSGFAFAEPENRTTRRKRRSRPRPSYRSQFKDGERRAVRRALTAAKLYLAGVVPTLATAAESCGTSVPYVRAAIVLLQAEDPKLVSAVLHGFVQLLPAARAMRSTARLISAYRAADSADKFAFGCAVPVGTVWDEVIVPVIDEDGTGGRHSPAYAP